MIEFPIYILSKYVAYSIWCYWGLRWLREQASVGAGLRFGFVRLGLGILFGVGVFFAVALLHLDVPAHPWTLYIAMYAPVRYVEWSIIAALLSVKSGELHRISDSATQWWIVGGIVVSHIADLPVILFERGVTNFLPVGRFLC